MVCVPCDGQMTFDLCAGIKFPMNRWPYLLLLMNHLHAFQARSNVKVNERVTECILAGCMILVPLDRSNNGLCGRHQISV